MQPFQRHPTLVGVSAVAAPGSPSAFVQVRNAGKSGYFGEMVAIA